MAGPRPFRGKRAAVVPLSRKQVRLLARDFGRRIVTRDAQAVISVEQREARARVDAVAAVSGQLGGVVILSATLAINWPSVDSQENLQTNITVPGVLVANTPAVAIGTAGEVEDEALHSAWVSANDTVTVKIWNGSASAINPGSVIYRVVVFQYP